MPVHEADVCVIGAGVVGCAIARELSRFRLKILLLERSADVVGGATRANSGIVHGGYSATQGTVKAELSPRGNRMFAALDADLHFGYREAGSLVLAFDPSERRILGAMADNGRRNGVDDLELLSPEQTLSLEPRVNTEITGSLLCPSAGVCSPYELSIALAENAVANGVSLHLASEVIGMEPGFLVRTKDRSFTARFVVNAAGLYSDRVAAMLAPVDFRIIPRQGQYVLLERGTGRLIRRVIFQVPSERGKGVLVTPTFHDNLMIGPNAEEVADREDSGTTLDALEPVLEAAWRSVPGFDLGKVITTFSGVRASSSTGDFVIGATEVAGFINAAGIDSPGLTSSPAIAERVRDLLSDAGLDLTPREDFDPNRRPIILKRSLTDDQIAELIHAEGPGRIVCRCEGVSEGEILDAMDRGIPVGSIAGIKWRTRACMGRCQGSFCRRRVAALIEERTGRSAEELAQEYESYMASKGRVKTQVLRMRERFKPRRVG